jgi:photosystem I subunit 3
MKKLFATIFLSLGFLFTCSGANASDIAGLTPCKDSKAFEKRLQNSSAKLESRMKSYDVGSPSYLALQTQLERTQSRFKRYGDTGMLCGNDGLPHLITDGRWSHAGDFTIPGIGFLYIAGWIGWAGRTYLSFTKSSANPTEKEIIIDVPLASRVMISSFSWPVSAWRELASGKLIAPADEITTSPR